jgi:hypothetical protein
MVDQSLKTLNWKGEKKRIRIELARAKDGENHGKKGQDATVHRL